MYFRGAAVTGSGDQSRKGIDVGLVEVKICLPGFSGVSGAAAADIDADAHTRCC
jgi:hypothetical protein